MARNYYRYYFILVIIQNSSHCIVIFSHFYHCARYCYYCFAAKRNDVVICANILLAFSRFFMDCTHYINRFSFILSSSSCILRPNVPSRCNKSEWKVLGYTASFYRMFVKYAGRRYEVRVKKKNLFMINNKSCLFARFIFTSEK